MKTLKIPLLLTLGLMTAGLVLAACNTTQQGIALKTIGTLESTATAGVDGYFALVAMGTLPTNDVPKVAKLYNEFQGGVIVALDAVQNNTNALAPPALAQEGADLTALLTTIEGGK